MQATLKPIIIYNMFLESWTIWDVPIEMLLSHSIMRTSRWIGDEYVCLLEASFRTKCFTLYATEVSHNQHHRWCEALTFHPVNLREHSTDFLAEFWNKQIDFYLFFNVSLLFEITKVNFSCLACLSLLTVMLLGYWHWWTNFSRAVIKNDLVFFKTLLTWSFISGVFHTQLPV